MNQRLLTAVALLTLCVAATWWSMSAQTTPEPDKVPADEVVPMVSRASTGQPAAQVAEVPDQAQQVVDPVTEPVEMSPLIATRCAAPEGLEMEGIAPRSRSEDYRVIDGFVEVMLPAQEHAVPLHAEWGPGHEGTPMWELHADGLGGCVVEPVVLSTVRLSWTHEPHDLPVVEGCEDNLLGEQQLGDGTWIAAIRGACALRVGLLAGGSVLYSASVDVEVDDGDQAFTVARPAEIEPATPAQAERFVVYRDGLVAQLAAHAAITDEQVQAEANAGNEDVTQATARHAEQAKHMREQVQVLDALLEQHPVTQ